MSNLLYEQLIPVLSRDSRYHYDGYVFVSEALTHAQERMLEESEHALPSSAERHLSGQQLCEAVRSLALDRFGYMAKTVLNAWGIFETADLGNIVYNMIEVELMTKSPHDDPADFKSVYDFNEVFCRQFQIRVGE